MEHVMKKPRYEFTYTIKDGKYVKWALRENLALHEDSVTIFSRDQRHTVLVPDLERMKKLVSLANEAWEEEEKRQEQRAKRPPLTEKQKAILLKANEKTKI